MLDPALNGAADDPLYAARPRRSGSRTSPPRGRPGVYRAGGRPSSAIRPSANRHRPQPDGRLRKHRSSPGPTPSCRAENRLRQQRVERNRHNFPGMVQVSGRGDCDLPRAGDQASGSVIPEQPSAAVGDRDFADDAGVLEQGGGEGFDRIAVEDVLPQRQHALNRRVVLGTNSMTPCGASPVNQPIVWSSGTLRPITR